MKPEEQKIIEQLIEWHESRVGNLKLIIDKDDADIQIDDTTIEAGTPLHRGILVGVKIALLQLGNLPISLKQKD